jgi:hypothetical protein
MELIAGIARQSAEGSREAVSSSTELRRLTETLQSLLASFNLDANGAHGANGAHANGANREHTSSAAEHRDGRGF